MLVATFYRFRKPESGHETHVAWTMENWGLSMNAALMFFVSAASLMFVDAVGYSLGALPPLQQALAPSDPYLKRRLLLNLMLANAGLYFTSLFTFVGAYISRTSPLAASIIMAVSAVVCFYSVVTILFFTPKDWKHAILRAFAGLLIVVGFMK